MSIPVWHDFSAVVEMGGHTTGTIPRFNTRLSLFYGMGGVRLRVVNHTHYLPFGQTLFGSVHGFDSYFPAPVGKLPTSYDTSFALTIGGVSTSLSLNTSGSGRCRLTTSTLNSAS